jgi:predicted dehydrogenase
MQLRHEHDERACKYMIRMGLLGASRVSRYAVIEPAAIIEGLGVSAVAARDAVRAASFAETNGIPRVQADYNALLASDTVDLVYIGLPPSGHARWTIAALEAGKHVLCEKPFAMNAAEAQAMVDTAKRTGKILIEAWHYRFHPLFARVLEVLDSGAIGAVQGIRAHFNVRILPEPGEIRYDPTLGGGAMMDLGCYCVHWARSVMGEEPAVLSAAAIRHETGVDARMDAMLVFPGGVRAEVSAAMSGRPAEGLDAELEITGERGKLTVVNPVSPHTGHELIIEAPDGRSREEVAGETTFAHQLRHVIGVLNGNAVPLTGGSDAIANMRVLDAIYRAAGMRPD